jgi:hypothetical protein
MVGAVISTREGLRKTDNDWFLVSGVGRYGIYPNAPFFDASENFTERSSARHSKGVSATLLPT